MVEMKYAVMAAAGLLMGVSVALGIGCEGESRLTVVMEEGAQAPRANLPSVPTLPPPPYPVQYPDGAFSIYGIRHMAARNWTKQVTVRGWVVKVYVPFVPNSRPQRVCTERDRCDELKPHVFIADAQNEQDPEKQMMVTGFAGFQSEIDDARLAAAHAHGLRLHAWKVCWQLQSAPTDVVARFREEGRLQLTDSGETIAWLCPS
ncbi:MAG: hypothetical protein WCJ30_10750, partial [Deltaproteobacteria bacterium]